MESKKSVALASVFLILFSLHCAKEGMPPGGPVDTAPPEVVSVSPQPYSTQVDLNSTIEITFSERMSNKPTEESIFISPFPKEPFDYKWKGKKLILSPPQSLLESKTYVVTIGTGAQDLRNNHLSGSYTFAFSTGSVLDSGTISGEVWTGQRDGSTSLTTSAFETEAEVSIWAYLFSDSIEADPEKDKPEYITQSDAKGKYTFKSLSTGRYRLFAVQDLNRDQIWNPDQEAIGVSTQDVDLTLPDVSKDHVDFPLALRDTTRPSVLNCQAVNKNLVRLDFDEKLREELVLNPGNFRIQSVVVSESLEVDEVFFTESGAQNIFILTAEMIPEEKYEVEVFKLEDESGNPLDTAANACLFVGSATIDTIGPKIILTSPKDGESNVTQDTKIQLMFDEPPEHLLVESNFSVSDSNGISVSGKGTWDNPNTFLFSPDTLLLGRMKYQVGLLSESVLDLLGNTMADSVMSLAFTTLNPDTLGSLSGLVLKARPEGNVHISGETTLKDIVVTLSLIEKSTKRYQKSLLQPGSFLFENILPGRYMIGAYADLNADGNLTIGKPKPFTPSEPFTFLADTIRVRSRWETQGVELELK